MKRSEFDDLHVIEHEGTAFNALVFFWDLTQSSLNHCPSVRTDADLIEAALVEVGGWDYDLSFGWTGSVPDPCAWCKEDLSNVPPVTVKQEEGRSYHNHCYEKAVEMRYATLDY